MTKKKKNDAIGMAEEINRKIVFLLVALALLLYSIFKVGIFK